MSWQRLLSFVLHKAVRRLSLNTSASCFPTLCSYLRQQRRHYKTHPADKQGILIVAGGRDMFANAAITIMTLRQHMQSQLPVEIVHFGQSELPPANLLSILQSLNKTSNNSTDWSGGRIYITDALHSSVQSRVGAHHKQYSDWKGFPAKPFALAYATRFQQVQARVQQHSCSCSTT